jgi:lipopolysaccharide export system protein LptA
VILVKGTMRATAERAQIRKDPEGYQHGVLQAAPGKLVSFRQRRDPTKPGVEEYVEGFAERIEYDERTETVRLITRARVRLLENNVQRDELRGDQITYDQRNSKYSVTGGKPATDPSNPDGRVRGTIAPRSAPAPESGTATPLKPATQITRPRE